MGRAAMEAVFAGPADSRLPEPIPAEAWDALLKEMVDASPMLTGLGFKAGIWVVGLSPVLTLRKLKAIDTLEPLEREKAIRALYESEWYLLRQLAMIFKTTGALAQASTTRMRDASLRTVKPLHPVAQA